VKRALPALVLVLVTSACSSAVSGTATPVPGAENLAVIDAAGTATALAAVKTAAEAVFSYDSTDKAAFDRTAEAHLTGNAKAQYTALFEQIRNNPQPVRLTTRVLAAAALELTGSRVRALAVLEQVNGTTKGLATVAFTALATGGQWRLSDIAVSPAQPPPAPHPEDGSAAGLRDSALTGARAAVTALASSDSADPEGSYTRAEAVTAEPLLSEYRTNKTAYVDGIRKSGVRAVVPPDLMTGVTTVTGDKAALLVYVNVQVTDAAGRTTTKPVTATLDLVRADGRWKAAGLRSVTAS
jgi:Mce-associated membrane protein